MTSEIKLDQEHMEHIAMLLSYGKDISDDYGRAMFQRIRELEGTVQRLTLHEEEMLEVGVRNRERVKKLEAELALVRSDATNFHNAWNAACHDIDKLKAERDELRNELGTEKGYIQSLQAELAKMKKYYRQPTHGPCCTCQHCGQHYDDCRCTLDEVAAENARLRSCLKRYGRHDPSCEKERPDKYCICGYATEIGGKR